MATTAKIAKDEKKPKFKCRHGDVLRFLVAHGERHLLQAQRVMEVLEQRAG